MDFAIQWLSYLLAFAAGSGVAWLIATKLITQTSDEPIPADAPGSTQPDAD